MKNLILFLTIVCTITSVAQTDSIVNRLRGIKTSSGNFYNVDGISFTSQTIFEEYSERNLRKAYRQYSIKKKDQKTPDTSITSKNFRVEKQEEIAPGLTRTDVSYFIKNSDQFIDAFSFSYFGKSKPEFEHRMIDLITSEELPKSCYSNLNAASINFAGREISLGGDCNWMNINNIQCPYNGQMNWSLHPSRESALLAIENQLKLTRTKNGGKVISEEEVDIEFEGVATKAKRILYDFTGVKSVLAGMSGGKNLTIYYVAEKVRGHYVSCVLSFWNNDTIRVSGLPSLLEEVIQLSQ